MYQIEDGTGELEIYFHPNISKSDRVTFIRFVTDHLRSKGVDIQEEIRLYCPKCNEEVKNRDAIDTRVNNGKIDIPCQYCSTNVLIPQSIEELYIRDPGLKKKQKELEETVVERTKKEIMQFKDDKQQYVRKEDNRIQILHISDIHLKNKSQANKYFNQLVIDLKMLEVNRLGYIIISGDIANQATREEYEAAYDMLNSLVNHFGLNLDRVVLVPGNHDLNWDQSEEAYKFFSKRRMPQLTEGKYITAGDLGVLIRDESLYKKRFSNFNSEFYNRLYRGAWDYPSEYDEQAIIVESEKDKILFLALNSSWEISLL